MKKKMIRCVFCCVTLAVLFLFSTVVQAESLPFEDEKSPAALLVEASSQQTILEKEADKKYPVAGLSRLPAILTICEAVDQGTLLEEDLVTVSEAAAAVPGPTAFLETSESISVQALLKSAIMISAGDSVMALAQKLHGTEQAFLAVVNQRLMELGIAATCESLSSTQTAFSARELAIMAGILAKSESFCKYSSLYLDGIEHEGGRYTELVNPNRMVKNYGGCYGTATGSSSEAGYCGVFTVRRADHDMICVVLGAKNSEERFQAAQAMLDYGLANYRSVMLATAGEIKAAGIPVSNGTIQQVDLVAKQDLSMLLKKDAEMPLELPTIPEKLDAPFAAGSVLGRIDYTDNDGRILATLELTAATGADVAGFGEYFRSVLLDWLRK